MTVNVLTNASFRFNIIIIIIIIIFFFTGSDEPGGLAAKNIDQYEGRVCTSQYPPDPEAADGSCFSVGLLFFVTG